LEEKELSLKERFKELGLVTRMLEEMQEKNEKLLKHFVWSMKSPFTLPVEKSKKRAAKQNAAKIIQSVREYGLVNEAWYLERNKDVAEAGTDPVEHYVRYGYTEGRAPGPEFE